MAPPAPRTQTASALQEPPATASSRAAAEACVDAGFAFLRYLRSRTPDDIAGLSLPQLRVLHLLSANAGASLGDLAESLCVAPPGLSKMVDALVERGLVTRATATSDRRRIELAVSPAGADVLRSAKQALVADLSQRLGALDAPSRAAVVRSLAQVRSALAPEATA